MPQEALNLRPRDTETRVVAASQDAVERNGLQIGIDAARLRVVPVAPLDLRTEHGFQNSYESVKRFVRKLKAKEPARVWRMECNPGEEAQVDFGLGAPIVEANGKRTRTWVLRVVLSHSRKVYGEAVLRQDTETFLRVLENAVRGPIRSFVCGDPGVLHRAWGAVGERSRGELPRPTASGTAGPGTLHSDAGSQPLTEDWRYQYNYKRPHGSLGNVAPAVAAKRELPLRPTACAPVHAGKSPPNT